MTTTIAILEAIGFFVAGLAARAVLVLAVMAVLAMPIMLLGMLFGWAGDVRRRHFGPHAHAAAHVRH
jgi:hypothetical protein